MKNIDSYFHHTRPRTLSEWQSNFEWFQAIYMETRTAYCAAESRVEWRRVAEAEECLTHLDAKVKVKVWWLIKRIIFDDTATIHYFNIYQDLQRIYEHFLIMIWRWYQFSKYFSQVNSCAWFYVVDVFRSLHIHLAIHKKKTNPSHRRNWRGWNLIFESNLQISCFSFHKIILD